MNKTDLALKILNNKQVNATLDQLPGLKEFKAIPDLKDLQLLGLETSIANVLILTYRANPTNLAYNNLELVLKRAGEQFKISGKESIVNQLSPYERKELHIKVDISQERDYYWIRLHLYNPTFDYKSGK